MTVQSTQLLHLAEETSDLAQEGGLSKDTTDNVWDARYNKIKNLLDPTDPGDAVNLNYITKNQTSLLTQLKNTGAAQNASIVSTGDTQNARLTATGDMQNTRLTSTGDTQNKRLTDTGDSYVATMTTLRDTTATKATEANNSADLAKKWAVSSSSPDGATDSKSSKTWAENAKASASSSASSASASASSATASQTSATNAASSASTASQKASEAASSASASATSAANAATSATNAKTSETNAAASATAAAKSAENAKTWDPENYYKKIEVDTKIAENQKVESISVTTDTTYVNRQPSVYKCGRLVFVIFGIKKTLGGIGANVPSTPTIISGLPLPVEWLTFTRVTSGGTNLRFAITVDGTLKEHFTQGWTTVLGDEFEECLTYICK